MPAVQGTTHGGTVNSTPAGWDEDIDSIDQAMRDALNASKVDSTVTTIETVETAAMWLVSKAASDARTVQGDAFYGFANPRLGAIGHRR